MGFGFQNFLMGNMMPNFDLSGGSGAPAIPNVNPIQNMMPNINPMMNGLQKPGGMPPMPMQGMPGGSPPLTPSPAAQGPAASSPEALGVNADQSNPMKNDMMRKMMMMQFLNKQQGKQQQPQGSAPPPIGGNNSLGSGNASPSATAPVSSFPMQMPQRPRFLTGIGNTAARGMGGY